MINTIFVSSRNMVSDIIHSCNKYHKSIGIISIVDYFDGELITESFKEKEQIKDVPYITCWFNDISKDECNSIKYKNVNSLLNDDVYILFNESKAKDIINFVDCIKDKVKVLIVHCTAGISRSGAVGYWVNKYLGLDENKFMRLNSQIYPNRYVYNILCEVSGLRNKIEEELKDVFFPTNIDSTNIL